MHNEFVPTKGGQVMDEAYTAAVRSALGRYLSDHHVEIALKIMKSKLPGKQRSELFRLHREFVFLDGRPGGFAAKGELQDVLVKYGLVIDI